ncbi:MAG: PD-(D/E)XK nuclease family protein [Geitlerinemataceae cyanobacterium]
MQRTLLLKGNLDRSKLSPKLHVITATPQAAKTLQVPHHSLEDLAQQICRQQGIAIAPILTSHRSLREAVRQAIDPDDLDGTARTWKRSVKAILRAGIDLETLESIKTRNLPQLARLTRTYQQQLRQLGAIDPAQVLWVASRLSCHRQALAIYGYFHPQPDELEFIDAISADGSVLVLADENLDSVWDSQKAIEELQKRGWILGETKANPKSVRRYAPGLCAYPNPEAEVRGALSQIKQLLQKGVRASDIVLVARDDAFYGPTVLDVAWEYELPMRALYATSLNTTRLGAWVRSLFEAIRSNFPFEATAKLLSHPLASARLQPIWAEVRQRHPQGLQKWQQLLGEDLSCLKWKQRDTRANWVQRLREVFDAFEVRQRCGGWAREIIAYYKLDEGLDAVAEPEGNRLTLEEFAREVTDSLNFLTVPAQPGRGGVELHTPKALWGAHYRYVFVLGMAEGLFPAPLKNDPVLDFYTRKQLIRLGFSLESATQAVRREALSFELLLQVATQTIVFSYPQQLEKEEMLPSPYLAKLDLKPQVPETIAVASREEARTVNLAGIIAQAIHPIVASDDRVFERVVGAWTVEQRRESAAPHDEYDGAVEIGIDPAQHVFSASQLTQLGQCGFKWFAGYLLKLAELTEAQTEFSGKLRGRLYHKTLELVAQKAQGKPDLRQEMLDAIDDAFAEAEKSENLLGIAAWDARRSEHLDLLRRTIAHESFISPDTEILGVELKFRGEWHGLKVEGIVDRIDSTPEGLCAIEYKNLSSKPTAAKNTSGKADLDVQLPLYSQVATAALFPDRPVSKAYYYSISKQKIIKADPDATELAEFALRIKQHLTKGHYPVQPDIDGKACQYCCQDLVCRQGKRLSRKTEEGV